MAKKKKSTASPVVARNRKARHDYHIHDTYEAGIALMGTEVKALRMGRASLTEGYAVFYRDELWLEQVHIPEYVQGTWTNHTPRRRRKLLLHRAELDKIAAQLQGSGRTVVPLSLYFSEGRVKVEIGTATGKKAHDKRHALRERQDRREAEREVSDRMKRRV